MQLVNLLKLFDERLSTYWLGTIKQRSAPCQYTYVPQALDHLRSTVHNTVLCVVETYTVGV